MNLEGVGRAVRHSEAASVMPVCGYVVLPRPGAREEAALELRRIDGCQVFPASNRDVLLLVTDTDSPRRDEELRHRLDRVPGIEALLLTFGEIDPDTALADPLREARL